MSARQFEPNKEWQLGPETLSNEHVNVLLRPASETARGTHSLDRPLAIITVEHAAWISVAGWALITRFAGLGMRPMGGPEANLALYSYDLLTGTNYAAGLDFHPVWGNWIHWLTVLIFGMFGASDLSARFIPALLGLAMVAAGFAMRAYLGRVGALCLVALIVISPSFTWFARDYNNQGITTALILAVVVLFLELKREPTVGRAILLGSATGLMGSASASGFLTLAMLVVALTFMGLVELIVGSNAGLRIRVWFARYSGLLFATILTCAIVWAACELVVAKPLDVLHAVQRLWQGGSLQDFRSGLLYYSLPLGLYEFLILVAGIIGTAAVLFLAARSRHGVFYLFWTILSVVYFLWSRDHASAKVLPMLLPAAMVAAIGIDELHARSGWGPIRVLLIVLGAITVYVQLMSNFVYYSPDASEAGWARHANLFWRDSMTTIQARDRLREIRREFPASGGAVFNTGRWQPALRWYLRAFRPTNDANSADIVINSNSGPPADSDRFEPTYVFDLSESWQPNLTTLSARSAFRFLFTSTAWGPLETIRADFHTAAWISSCDPASARVVSCRGIDRLQ